MHELILGGQRSGKSRRAEDRARTWLRGPGLEATLIATALPGDAEMRERIARHRAERAPGLATIEAPHALAAAFPQHSEPHRLLIVDCLTLWITNLLMPMDGPSLDDAAWRATRDGLLRALAAASGPVVLVSNEIGMGVVPPTPESRRFVDELGRLHQEVAAVCERVTLMVAGIEVPVKRP